jgi:hypothetical protein
MDQNHQEDCIADDDIKDIVRFWLVKLDIGYAHLSHWHEPSTTLQHM